MMKLQSVVALILLPSMGLGFAPSVRPAVVRDLIFGEAQNTNMSPKELTLPSMAMTS
jgi:hypothetical protein